MIARVDKHIYGPAAGSSASSSSGCAHKASRR
jgi:hypothetical protein